MEGEMEVLMDPGGTNSSISRRAFVKKSGLAAVIAGCASCLNSGRGRGPNIFFTISDDQTWMHAGAYGDPAIETPAFDRIAKGGVLFRHAYVACPSCTPSRGAVLTGRPIWQLEQGGQLFGTLPAKFAVFPRMLEQAGYFIGWAGAKAWGPGELEPGGRTQDPAGRHYNRHRLDDVPEGMVPDDYYRNFLDFLNDREPEQPFCFWFGPGEAHRSFKKGIGRESGIDPGQVRGPGCLPDAAQVRDDIADYYAEIERYDRDLGRMLDHLQETGELDNTLVIVTSDNGMPFPRCKATLYDAGVRVPFAVRFPAKIPGGRTVEDFVSLIDVAPTVLDACSLEIPREMAGASLMPILASNRSGRVDPDRDFVVTAFERHTLCRPNDVGYPMRSIRTHDYLYIRNYQPGRWPAGDPDLESVHQGVYGDIDNGPSKSFMLEHRKDPEFEHLFRLGFGKRPGEELYDVKKDPHQLNNLAGDPQYAEIKAGLSEKMIQYLQNRADPRMDGLNPWDSYPYYFGDLWKK